MPDLDIHIRVWPPKAFNLPEHDAKVVQIRYKFNGVDRERKTIVQYGGVNLNSSDILLTSILDVLKQDWKKLNPYFKEEGG